MIEYILVIYIFAGAMSQGDSVTTAVVPGFITLAECQTAGTDAKSFTTGTTKETRWKCFKQTKAAK